MVLNITKQSIEKSLTKKILKMIKEDFVSFELAKLLREKGFNEFCYYYYMENGGIKLTNNDKEHNFYPRPTLQMAMKWLREVHNIDIDITAQVGMLQVKRYVPSVETYNPKFDEELGKNRLNQKSHSTSKPLKGEILPVYEDFATYEEACEAGIKYCLENLV